MTTGPPGRPLSSAAERTMKKSMPACSESTN
jgi:hypothetical protein